MIRQILEGHALLAPAHRFPVNIVAIFITFVLLLLMATGALNLSLNLAWTDSAAVAGGSRALIDMSFNVGNLFSPFDRNSGFDSRFWSLQVVLFLLALSMSFFRTLAAAGCALLALILVYVVSSDVRNEAVQDLISEYGVMSIAMLFLVHVLITFFGEMRDKYALMRLFSEFIPPELVRQYSSDPQSVQLVGDAREVTVLFCDVRGFTSISERLAPSLLAQWLNMYFDVVSEVVVKHQGTIDKYIGDSVMAIWGAPVADECHADKAIAAAMESLKAVETLNVKLRQQHLPEISVSIGVSSGFCNAGILGSKYRRSYTVVGDTVNIAQRLETLTRKYKVDLLISDATRQKCQSKWLYRELSTEAVKGRKRFVKLNQPVALDEDVSPALRKQVSLHNHAMSLIDKRQWFQAQAVLEYLEQNSQQSGLYQMLLERLEQRRARRARMQLLRSSSSGALANVYGHFDLPANLRGTQMDSLPLDDTMDNIK